MLDNKGSFYIIDVILAVILMLIVFLIVNITISVPDPLYSDTVDDFKTSQDIMEILNGKVNFTDHSFIGDISKILKDDDNSKKSIRDVSEICKNKFNKLKIKNYRFSETNILDGTVLASSGDYNSAKNVSTASRSYGDYSYSLSVW